MNNVDKQYLDILKDIIENGVYKNTRSGEVYSVFGRTMRFKLSEGLPLLTTKKVFTKGVIHELLWFLKGGTNIKYLVDNNVNIWTDDAFRYYKEEILSKKKYIRSSNGPFGVFQTRENGQKSQKIRELDLTQIPTDKETFIQWVKSGWMIDFLYNDVYDDVVNRVTYNFGDLGPVYGKQWREWTDSEFGHAKDQISELIKTLKKNPDSRRMMLSAWNVSDLEFMALPPCHVFSQFYTRELSPIERLDWLCEHSNGEYDEWKAATHETLDKLNVPKRELSCSFYMRSNDFFLGTSFNILSYALLTHMIAQCCNMTIGELVYNGGDVHLYQNHIEAAKEQLSRDPYLYDLAKLRLNPQITNIDDFKYEDVEIVGYNSYPAIKAPLSVG